MIAYIGDQPRHDMLHLEHYERTEFGELSSPKVLANVPFFRRKDVMDRTNFLDGWKHTAAWKQSSKYEYKPRDAACRRFLTDSSSG